MSFRSLKLILMAGGGGFSAVANADSTRVMVVPNDASGAAALSATANRTLAVYPAFTVVEAPAESVEALLAAGGELRDDMREIQVGEQKFDPTLPNARRFGKSSV